MTTSSTMKTSLKRGRPATGRVRWSDIPIYEREREQRSIMIQHRFEQDDFFNHVLNSVKPIDNNVYIATCINLTLRLIEQRVSYRIYKRDQGLRMHYSHLEYGSGRSVSSGFEGSGIYVTTSYKQYDNGYFNETAMTFYLRAKVVKELTKWLNGEVDRGKWTGPVEGKGWIKDLDTTFQPFVKYIRNVINKRERDFFGSKLNLLTNDHEYVYRP